MFLKLILELFIPFVCFPAIWEIIIVFS